VAAVRDRGDFELRKLEMKDDEVTNRLIVFNDEHAAKWGWTEIHRLVERERS
jgi:hypothetical protein